MGVFKILKGIKSIFVHIRSSFKVIFLIIIATTLITGIILSVYKPIYTVTLNGEFIGYTANKSKLQNRINEYLENGDGSQTIAFIDLQNLPEYSLCLLKRDNVTNDDEIFDRVKSLGVTYYRYYAIMEKSEEKFYIANKEDAEEIIDKLKEKKSRNINDLKYVELHSTELKEFADKDKIVTSLYKKPVVIAATYGVYNGPRIINSQSPSSEVLGIGLVKPIPSGYTITSRFGPRGSGFHKGLDIAAPIGTPIAAAAPGTVEYSGWSSSGYGNYIKISHGNGVETLYAHCSKLYVQVGQTVSGGEVLGAVGSTGRSSGPHLHLEIRLNGEPQNPQLYLYK